MDYREGNFSFLSTLLSGMKPEPHPENVDLNTRLFKPPSPNGDYKPNTLFENPFHFENQDSRGIDLNYSDQCHQSSPLLSGNHVGGTTVEGSSSNPFCGVDLATIKGFNQPFNACYNQADNPNLQSNDVNIYPYAPTAAASFAGSQKAVMHGEWGDYDDAPRHRPQDQYHHQMPDYHHHHQMPAVQPLPEATQATSCVQLPPLVNFQEFESATPRVMLPSADEYSCNIIPKQNELGKKKRHYTKKASKDGREAMIIKGQWTPQEDRLLTELVERYGDKKWSQISKVLKGRVGKQCRERWHNHLRPDIRVLKNCGAKKRTGS
nr:MYB transcription factor protein [Rosa persica]